MQDQIPTTEYSESRSAFNLAISKGVLSLDMNARNYVGGFMFMGCTNSGLAFKNIVTRSYIHLVMSDIEIQNWNAGYGHVIAA